MGSYYQSLSYLKGGGTRKSRNTKKGGFYPSIMGGVMKYGSYLIPIAMRHGMKLMNSKKTKKSRGSKKNKKNNA